MSTISGDPVADVRGFRDCLGQFSTGVTVITAHQDGQQVGVTANSFSSLSLEPPLILWSIKKNSRSRPAFEKAENFAINILSDKQVDISQNFSSNSEDKFASVSWFSGSNGAPLLAGCVASLECTTQMHHDAGDHILIIGKVTRFARDQHRSLIFSQGRYSVAVDHPSLLSDMSGVPAPGAGDAETDSFGTLLFQSHICFTDGFDGYRAILDMSAGAGRVLYVLSQACELTFDDLVKNAHLPAAVVSDSVADLIRSGDVVSNATGALSLTAHGLDRRSRAKKLAAAYENHTLQKIDPSKIEIAKDVLRQYLGHSAN